MEAKIIAECLVIENKESGLAQSTKEKILERFVALVGKY